MHNGVVAVGVVATLSDPDVAGRRDSMLGPWTERRQPRPAGC